MSIPAAFIQEMRELWRSYRILGRMPAYHAGLFYIQEPSAMLPARVLAASPGDTVLDLCAAPGGKTARIASDLSGEGLLWANEISADRARALYGVFNLLILSCGR